WGIGEGGWATRRRPSPNALPTLLVPEAQRRRQPIVADDGVREDGGGGRTVALGVGQRRAEVGQPELARRRLTGDLRRLAEEHVLHLERLGQVRLLGVHRLGD